MNINVIANQPPERNNFDTSFKINLVANESPPETYDFNTMIDEPDGHSWSISEIRYRSPPDSDIINPTWASLSGKEITVTPSVVLQDSISKLVLICKDDYGERDEILFDLQFTNSAPQFT